MNFTITVGYLMGSLLGCKTMLILHACRIDDASKMIGILGIKFCHVCLYYRHERSSDGADF